MTWRLSPQGMVGATIGTLFLLLLMHGTLSTRWCGWLTCRAHLEYPHEREAAAWSPFVDRAGTGTRPVGDDSPKCPANPDDLVAPPLVRAPLPAEFNPIRFDGGHLYACLFVQEDGSVGSAHLIGWRGAQLVERELISTIRAHWRFQRPDRSGTYASWQRIRLTTGTPEVTYDHRY